MPEFVPPSFVPPAALTAPQFRLEPLGPEHNERDFAAWTGSMAHIHSTPGFEHSSWPHEMTEDENLDDLRRHRRDFDGRTGFTYSVLEPGTDDVIGCVYIYPLETARLAAKVSSWVTERRAELDAPLHSAVCAWLASDWPFELVEYAAR